MRILQVVPYFSWSHGGPVRVVYELSKALAENGHSVTIFTTDVFRGHRILEEDKIMLGTGVDVRYFKCVNNWLANEMKLQISPEMNLAIKKELKNYDIVHLHDYRSITHFYVEKYSRLYNVPYILQAHGAAPKIYGKQSSIFTFLKIFFDLFFGNKILENSSKLIALTEFEAGQYLQIKGDPKKIEIVPNGIRLSEYEKLPNKGEFRKKYSIKDNERIILYLGRIHKIKGIDLLIKSFSKLGSELNNTKLVIVGPDDGFLATILQQIKNLNIEDKVILTGPLYGSEKLSAYIDANLYVLPSIYETFPMTVLEAFACGTPVIITDRCGISDLVKRVGLVVKFDETELKNAIVKILNDDELCKNFTEESKKLVQSRFDFNIITENIISTYNECIKGNLNGHNAKIQ